MSSEPSAHSATSAARTRRGPTRRGVRCWPGPGSRPAAGPARLPGLRAGGDDALRRHGRGRPAGRRRGAEARVLGQRAAVRLRAGRLNLDNTASSGAGAVLYLEPRRRRARPAAGRQPGQPGQPAARRSDPERGHGAHGLDLPRPGRRRGRPDRRGGRHRLHQRAGHDARRARPRDRQGHGQDHARQAGRRRTPTRPRCRSRSREPAPRARASSSATTPATRPPATCSTSATAGRARTGCG